MGVVWRGWRGCVLGVFCSLLAWHSIYVASIPFVRSDSAPVSRSLVFSRISSLYLTLSRCISLDRAYSTLCHFVLLRRMYSTPCYCVLLCATARCVCGLLLYGVWSSGARAWSGVVCVTVPGGAWYGKAIPPCMGSMAVCGRCGVWVVRYGLGTV